MSNPLRLPIMCSILHLKVGATPGLHQLSRSFVITYGSDPYWLTSCILRLCSVAQGQIDRGAILWNLTGDIVTRKPGRTLLPVLTVLFVVSYGLLTMLVVEQGRTIDSQRNLIRMLFDDSIELNGMKGKANQKRQEEARAQAQAQSKMKTPPTQTPQMQAPSSPSPRAGAKSQSTSKFGRPRPQKPPKDTSDQGDERRMLITI
jgi:hypothetical protein